MRQAVYNYSSSGLLTSVNYQALQSNGTYSTSSTVGYQYNSSNQLSAVIAADGTTTLTTADNVRGQSTEETSDTGNMAQSTYTLDPNTGDTTTQVKDMGSTGASSPTAQGIAAIEYVAAGSSSTSQFDAASRETSTTNALGNTTSYGYTGTSLLPNSVTLPTPGSPTITIKRNAANLPTVVNNPADSGGTPVTYHLQLGESSGRRHRPEGPRHPLHVHQHQRHRDCHGRIRDEPGRDHDRRLQRDDAFLDERG